MKIRIFASLCLLATTLLQGQAATNIPTPATLQVMKSGGDVQIRSPFYDGKDLLIWIGLGLNHQINSRSTFLVDSSTPMSEQIPSNALTIHGNGDDAAAWRINSSPIGANHGVEGVCEMTSVSHGLTTADLGREWCDEGGQRFYLIKVVSSDSLWFLGKNSVSAPFWKFDTVPTGQSLTASLSKRMLPFSKYLVTQLRPACRIRRQDYLINGNKPLENGQISTGSFLEIAEEYDIINPGSVLADIIAHPGMERSFIADHLDAVLRNGITYRFYPNGSCVIDTKSKALQSFNLVAALFVMTAKLTTMHTSYSREYYVPKTKPFILGGRAFDFQRIQNCDEDLSEAVHWKADGSYVENPQNLPERFIQFLARKEDGKSIHDVGFALGYSLIHGITQPQQRAANASEAGWLNTNIKTYPTAMDSKMGVIPAGMEFNCVGYRDYFSPRDYPDASCVYWHPEGDDILVYADYHQKLDSTLVKLPPEFTGRKIAIVEQTPSINLQTKDIVPSAGIALSVAENYGYIVLKLSSP